MIKKSSIYKMKKKEDIFNSIRVQSMKNEKKNDEGQRLVEK